MGASSELAATWSRFPNDPALPAGEAVRSRTPVLLTDLAERDRRFPVLAGLPAAHRSHAIMPLFAGDTPVGYLGLGWKEPRQFPPDEVSFLQRRVLTEQAGHAHDDMALIILRPTAPAPAPPAPRTPARARCAARRRASAPEA